MAGDKAIRKRLINFSRDVAVRGIARTNTLAGIVEVEVIGILIGVE